MIFAIAESPHPSFSSLLGNGLLAGGAALIAGALLGFLFGLPRTADQTDSSASLLTNGNLDQISDWLTKILVGLGLVQLGKIPGAVNNLAAGLAPALGGEAAAQPFAVALLVYCAIDGFLLGYLWTRIVLSGRLKQAADELAQAANAAQALSKPLPPAPAPLPAPPGSAASGSTPTPPVDE